MDEKDYWFTIIVVKIVSAPFSKSYPKSLLYLQGALIGAFDGIIVGPFDGAGKGAIVGPFEGVPIGDPVGAVVQLSHATGQKPFTKGQ